MNKKQRISAVMAMALAITICAAAIPASAEDLTSGDANAISVYATSQSGNSWEFDTSTGTLTVTSDEGTTEWQGSGISKTDIKSVVIESGVTRIKNYAFYGCTNLNSATISEGVKTIGEGAFFSCTKLETITIPSTVKTIGKEAFAVCTNLNSATISEGVETIDDGAFGVCGSLESIIIPKTVKTIGARAFANTRLKTVIIPKSVETIYESVFENCDYLGTVYYYDGTPTSNLPIDRAVKLTENENHELTIAEVNLISEVTEYTVPNEIDGKKVVAIGTEALMYKSQLKSVTISDGIEAIGEGAFGLCENLTSITIPSSVKTIGAEAFVGCTKLGEAELPEGVETIGKAAFSGCESLETVKIPSTVKTMGRSAFLSCTNLKSVTIAEGAEAISEYAFGGCENLTSITIPSSVKNIDKNAFTNCINLNTVTITEGVETIGEYAFYNCKKLETITIPNSVKTIGEGAFNECSGLKSADISGNDGTICRAAFSQCTSLESLTIHEGIKNINEYAFNWCENLNSVTINGDIETIDGYAFNACKKLKSIVIFGNITNVNANAIAYCDALETIYYCEGTPTDNLPTDCAHAKIIENSDGTVTLEFTYIPTGATKVVIHDIGKTVTKVILPSGIEGIKVEHTDHFEDAGTVTVPATTESEGEKVYKCTVGGEILRTETLKKLDDTTTAATGSSSFAPTPNSFTAPSINASVEIKNGKAVISWDKVKNADSYVVYIKKNGKYVKLIETEKTSVTVKNLKAGQSYSFKVAYKINGRVSKNAQEILVTMSGVQKPTVTASSDENSVTLRWNKVEGAEAYAVYKVTDGKAKKLIETQKNGVKINGLESQTEYSYIVRVKINGEWSTMKKSDIVNVMTK